MLKNLIFLMKPTLYSLLALPLFLGSQLNAEDWGAYQIVPVSAPDFALEVVGDTVSIQKPEDQPNQKWIIQSHGGGWNSIMPASQPGLVLTVDGAGTKNGTKLILAKDNKSDAQLWSLARQENGAYALEPKHAPGMGLDHLGGRKEPGAKVDLWQHKPGDGHLQWFIRPLAGSNVVQPSPAAPSYTPPAMDPKDIQQGRIETFQFTQSKIFPGTVREVTVFIPAQYDASKPACVYVKTDGYNPREKANLELAIATKEMPVTVGVFVRPGELPAPMKGTAPRRNRDFEYDGVSDNNVRFFDEEVLPFVAKQYQLNLSTSGNDRCIVGGSSGGITAFAAAWHKPEAFSRVYCVSGSFVAFRGGHEFPTMVRKFEARPIRAYLTTGTRDMENVAGDWFLVDQEMDKALKFSGYDYQFRIIDGGHGAGYGDEWQEAMAYLWKNWPEPVKAGPSAPRAQEILIPGEDWQLAGEGFKSTRGASTAANGEIFFADTSADQIHRIGLDGKISVFAEKTGNAHCVTVAADGSLYTISEKSGQLLRYDNTGRSSVVLEGILGHSILAHPNGSLYVTDNDAKKPVNGGSVWLIKDGRKKQVDAGLKFATGMAFRPDQWLLSVAEGHSKWACSYQVAEDGTLIHKERFFHLHVHDWDDDAGAECLCYSQEGRQFIATKSGIQISADDGPTQVILTVPGKGRVTAVAIGGRDKDTLYAFCMNKIWKRRIQQHALGAWSPWTKVTPNKL